MFTMDDDLQHQPSDLPKFIKMKEHDVIVGIYAQRHHSWFKRLTSRIKAWFDHILLGKPKNLTLGPYRMHKAIVVKRILSIHTPYPFMPALMFYVTRDIATVPIQHSPRQYGHSDYTTLRRMRTFSNLLINNSSFLLRVTSAIGIGVAVISFLISIYFFIKNLPYGIPMPGWTSLMVVILVTNGLILFAIGVVGEYLLRIAQGIEQRPPYIVRHVITKRQQPHEG